MRIPVFVSSPTSLNAKQKKSQQIVYSFLDEFGLEERRLGKSDYPTSCPLQEVVAIARHCAGGVVLGFEQLRVLSGTHKPGQPRRPGSNAGQPVKTPLALPTPWNHIEAGILFGLRLPILIFRERGVEGGIFDPGVSDVFIHWMPAPTTKARAQLRDVFMKWRAAVGTHYYSMNPNG